MQVCAPGALCPGHPSTPHHPSRDPIAQVWTRALVRLARLLARLPRIDPAGLGSSVATRCALANDGGWAGATSLTTMARLLQTVLLRAGCARPGAGNIPPPSSSTPTPALVGPPPGAGSVSAIRCVARCLEWLPAAGLASDPADPAALSVFHLALTALQAATAEATAACGGLRRRV
jgi:hypothetical protein